MRSEGVEPAIARIAAWTSGLTLAQVPEPVREVARACLVDTIGVAIAGSATRVAALARSVAQASAAAGPSSVLGRQERVAAPAAAFVNGAAAHALDFDDNCYAGVVHGSAVIVPAALAVAEACDLSGAQLLAAFVAGSEAEYAVGMAAGLSLYDRGWWTTGVLGPIGAAVAAAHALGLDAAATAAALGLAVAGAGGAKACFGTDGKPLLCGRAAEAGVVAALMAQAGASGPVNALEHPRGFAGLMNGGAFDGRQIDELGRTWRLLTPGIDVKRIPVCLSSHAAVDAAAALVRQHGLDTDAIRRITCDVPPIVVANLAHDRPRTPQEAQFSMPFAVAVSLRRGDLGLADLSAETLAEPAVQTLMAKVAMCTGPRWDSAEAREATPEGAEVAIEMEDGRVLAAFLGFPRGAASHPLAAAEIDAKFMACAAGALGAAPARGLLIRLRAVDTLISVRRLLAAPDPT